MRVTFDRGVDSGRISTIVPRPQARPRVLMVGTGWNPDFRPRPHCSFSKWLIHRLGVTRTGLIGAMEEIVTVMAGRQGSAFVDCFV